MNDTVLVYRIDRENIITSVNDNWDSFALGNDWAGECRSDKVVGHLLWDFIQGLETRYLYEILFKGVRKGKGVGPISFRCDSPWERRFLELFLSLLPGGRIEITSIIVRSEPRQYVKMLDRNAPRSSSLITICSMCKKIAITRKEWFEVEEGLIRLRLFEADEVPGLSHGLCPTCFQAAMDELD